LFPNNLIFKGPFRELILFVPLDDPSFKGMIYDGEVKALPGEKVELLSKLGV